MGIRQAGLPLGAALATLILRASPRLTTGARPSRWGVSRAARRAEFRALLSRAGQGAPLRKFPPLGERFKLLRLPGMARIVWPGVTLVSLQFALTIYLPLDLRDRFGLPIETGVALLFAAQGAASSGASRWPSGAITAGAGAICRCRRASSRCSRASAPI